MVLPQTRAGIFDRRDEIFNLTWPIVILAIAFTETFFFPVLSPTEQTHRLLRVMFLDSAHTILTLLMIFGLPELRLWKQKISNGKPLRFWLPVAAAFSVGAYVLLAKLSPLQDLHPLWALNLVVAVQLFVANHHSMTQMFGLSMTYNRIFEPRSNEERVSIARCERIERLAMKGLIFGKFATYVIVLRLIPSIFPAFSIKLALSLFMFICATTVITAGARTPGADRSWKPAYLLRLLIPVFAPFSFVALSASLLFHGLEYIFVVRKMVSRSKLFVAVSVFWLVAVCVMVLRIVPEGFFAAFWPGAQSLKNPLLLFALSIASGVGWIHYWLDRQLFRVREPASRIHVLPLLMPKNN